MEAILVINVVLLWIIVLFNLLLSIALARKVSETNKPPEPETLNVGETAPQFSLPSLNGEMVSFDNFKQKNLLMVFVSANCSHCRPQMPVIKAIQPKARQDGIEVVLVGLGKQDAIQEYIREFEIDFPILVTEYASPFALDYKIRGTPSYYFIDQNRSVLSAGFFDRSWEELIQKWQTTN